MATVSSSASPRREDFSLDVFRYLEAKLQEFRRLAMKTAATIAEQSSKEIDVYHVERKHVDSALAKLLSEPETCKEALGLRKTDQP